MIWSICRLLDSQKLITIARDRDSEDCYVSVVLFLLVFSVHRFFDVPGPIFAKLPHDAVGLCPEVQAVQTTRWTSFGDSGHGLCGSIFVE